MNLNSISQNPLVAPQPDVISSSASSTEQATGLPFASLVNDVIQSVDAHQQTVAVDVQKLANGEADNLQSIAANMAKADLSFRFLMEIRDKFITSYQEVMRMQV